MEKKYKAIIQIHHMTELLESVDWDEEVLNELLVEVESLLATASNLDADIAERIETKFGTAAKNALQSIINTELYKLNLCTQGDKSVN